MTLSVVGFAGEGPTNIKKTNLFGEGKDSDKAGYPLPVVGKRRRFGTLCRRTGNFISGLLPTEWVLLIAFHLTDASPARAENCRPAQGGALA